MAAAAALTMSACSNDEVIDVQRGEAIGFTALSNNATRATPIESTNLKSTDFKVWGFLKADNSTYVNGVCIRYSDSKWDYAQAWDVAYWPTGALDFYAVSPSTAGTPNITYNARTINFTVDDNQATQKDLMYASKPNHAKTNGATVPFFFKHALSQIVFKGQKALASLEVEVQGIKVHNLKNTGVFTFPSTQTEAGATAGSWSVTGEATNNYALGMAAAPVTVVSDKSATNLTAIDGALLLMPQTLTPWTTKPTAAVPVATAEQQKHCYLEIDLKVKQAGTYIVGDASSFGKAYVPFGETWEPGKKYIYTLKFGGGYDKDGKPQLQPIMYSATVENWTEASNEVNLNV